MSSAESLFQSFVIMILCLISSVLIIAFISAPGEIVQKEIINTGIADAPPEWGGQGLADFGWDIEYLLPSILSFYGLAQFVYTAVRRQKYDIYGQPVEEF